ncbi:CD82 antigen isoform X2 [Onthophagus taurus]|uniref:CD82 antigen isoform X2 n=1 Tax=Onthophagus taurus TaxID=166361 RepID=UPI0039BE7E87
MLLYYFVAICLQRERRKSHFYTMVYDCGSCLAKYILCLFNFAFFIAGSVVLSVGVWLAVDKSSFIGLLKAVPNEHLPQFTQPAVIEQASYILIVAGAFMFLVSFLGYCGALRESRCLLTTYGICLLLILILEITAGGLAAAYRGKAEIETRNFLKTTIKKYSIEKYTAASEESNAITLMWNHFQAQLKCCGVDNYKDFNTTNSDKKIPISCCVLEGDKSLFKPMDPSCTSNPTESNSYFLKGCYDVLLDWILAHINVVIGVGIGLGVAQLLCIFFAFCLTKSLNSYGK